MKVYFRLFFLCFAFGCFVPSTAVAKAQRVPEMPVVHAILFFSPTCPHCHEIITNVLPPLVDQYGDQLQIAGIDTSYEMGQHLYQTAVTKFQIPDTRIGVPTLIVGDLVLVGSLEIPELFPTIIEDGLASGGIPWPDMPELMEFLPESSASDVPDEAIEQPAAVATAVPLQETAVATEPNSALLSLEEVEAIDSEQSVDAAIETPPADPVGFALGCTVLLGLVTGLGYGLWYRGKKRPFALRRQAQAEPNKNLTMWVLGLVALGLIVAGYLAYVETAQVTAVCGPIGECNIVQSSPYARLFGIPVAIFGVLSYLAIGVLWVLRPRLDKTLAWLAGNGLLALTLFGTIFSIYLTALELLVIHAICAWCLSSAVITLCLYLMIVRWLPQRPSLATANVQAGD